MGVTDICPLFSILFHPKKLIHEVKKKITSFYFRGKGVSWKLSSATSQTQSFYFMAEEGELQRGEVSC